MNTHNLIIQSDIDFCRERERESNISHIMAIIGLGRLDYKEFGASELKWGLEFDKLVSRLGPDEFIIFGSATQTEVVEDENHFRELVTNLSEGQGIYKINKAKLDPVITLGNSRLNWMNFSQLMTEKRKEGKFEYVKTEGGRERRKS